MPSLFDKLLRRKPQPKSEPPLPETLYSPPERGAPDPEPSDFNVGNTVRAMGTDQSGAPAVADGVRRELPGPFIVPDRTNGTIKGVDQDLIFVAFPVMVPAGPWRHVRSGEGPEYAPGDRLKSIGDVPTEFGVIPHAHIVNVLDAPNADDMMRVQLMLQFNKQDWWNRQEPERRKWGKFAYYHTAAASKQAASGDKPPRGSFEWNGMPVAVEYFGGERRPPFDRVCPCPYGYFEGSHAMDSDSVDVLVGPNWRDLSCPVWVVEQMDWRDPDRTNQYKTFIGFDDARTVEEAFLSLWPPYRLGELASCTPQEYRDVWFPELNEEPQLRAAAAAEPGEFGLRGWNERYRIGDRLRVPLYDGDSLFSQDGAVLSGTPDADGHIGYADFAIGSIE